MSGEKPYTPYHPRWYRRRMSVWWWLEKWSYARFVLRELTSVFVAYFALVCLWQIRAAAQGPEAYGRFVARMQSGPFLVLSAAALVFVLFHAVSWLNLAPKAMVLALRGKRVPDAAVAALNYLAWLLASAGVAFLLLRG